MSDYLPTELQIEILKRLPIKSVIQCISVCKMWNALIKSPNFISAHLNQTLSSNNTEKKEQTLLIRYYDRSDKLEKYILGKDDETFGQQFSKLEFPFKSYIGYFRVVASCSGLLCLCDDLFSNMHDVILWNPSIRKSVRIIVPNVPDWPHMVVLGFGVCPITHDPKVVKIVYVKDFSHIVKTPPEVEVFAVSSEAWRKPTCDAPPCYMIEFTWYQAFVNGTIYWIAYDKRVEGVYRNLIVSFDLVGEMFEEITLPDTLACQPFSNLTITALGQSVALLEYDREIDGVASCSIWVMKENGYSVSWPKLFTIDLVPPSALIRTVGFRKNGDAVLALKNNELACYEPKRGQVKSLGVFGNIRSFFMDAYEETLVLLSETGLPDAQVDIYMEVDEDGYR